MLIRVFVGCICHFVTYFFSFAGSYLSQAAVQLDKAAL